MINKIIVLLAIGFILMGPTFILAQEVRIVSATTETGTSFIAPQNGSYLFTIIGGAYINTPSESQPEHPEWWGYTNKVLGYINRPISWSSYCYESYPGPGVWDFEMGSWAHYSTAQAAQDALSTPEKFVSVTLKAGDEVIFVIQDCQTCCFNDNTGQVYIQIATCDFSTQPGIEKCFGGIGRQCEELIMVKDYDTCMVTGPISAGSIVHDRCCIETGNTGYKCGQPDGRNACKKAWDLAVGDYLCGRVFWAATWGRYYAGGLGDCSNLGCLNLVLRLPKDSLIHPDFEAYCESGKCLKDAKGRTIKWQVGACKYCQCD